MTDQPLTIVHIVPRDGLGGVETAARSMAARDDLPCDFHLLFLTGKTLAADNPRVEAPGGRSTADPLSYLRLLRRCRALDPDLIVVSLWRSVPLLALLRLALPRAKLVMTLNSGRDAHFADALLTRVGTRLADEVWSDSEATVLARGLGGPHRIVSFVADRLPASASATPRPHFAAWARIDQNKGFDIALRLVARLASRGLDPQFALYGPDGGASAALRRQAASLQIADCVHFGGPIHRADLARVAAGASFFLLPSRLEGMAMACVEAMQLGLVPVVTPAGEMASYVVPGYTGVLIDPARLDAAADDIAALLAEPVRFAALQRGAIARWSSAPLYPDAFCAAALALAQPGPAATTAGA